MANPTLSIAPPAPAAPDPTVTLVSSFRLRLERQDGVWLDRSPVACPAQAAERLYPLLPPERLEVGGALFLDAAGAPIGYRVSSLPPCEATGCELRDLLATALLSDARALILGHRRDTRGLATQRSDLDRIADLVRLGHAIRLAVLDYLVLAADGRFSSLQDEFPELWLNRPRHLLAWRSGLDA